MRKGIVLAGGSGTRLYPSTIAISKQLLPVYDKPMIFYPLCVLVLSGIREILLITTPNDIHRFEQLLGDGSQWGIDIQYLVQSEPNGIAEAFVLGKNFIGDNDVALILGDNIFYGHNLSNLLDQASSGENGASIFAYRVKDPGRYGVVDFDSELRVRSIIEKPDNPKSNYAATGLYFYSNEVVNIASGLSKSSRGELEITDVNNEYLQRGLLSVQIMDRGFAWFDTGTHDSLLDAGNFIATLERRQGLKVCCIEEIVFELGYIDREQLKQLAASYGGEYRDYLDHI